MRFTPAPIILCGLFLTPTASAAQTQDSVGVPRGTAGRFQLVTQDEGTMFLVDSTTGRVWRYTQVVSEKEVQAREAARQREAQEATQRAAEEEWRAAEPARRAARELALEQSVAQLMLDRVEERRRRGESITPAQRLELRQRIRTDLLAGDPTLLAPESEPALEPAPEPEIELPPILARGLSPALWKWTVFGSRRQAGSLKSSRISECKGPASKPDTPSD